MYIYHKSVDFKSVQHHSSKQLSLVPSVTSIKHLNLNSITKKNIPGKFTQIPNE